jgi:hypothetical protein
LKQDRAPDVSFISQNWRGEPLITHQVIVIHLIAATTTKNGLKIRAEIEPVKYPKGLRPQINGCFSRTGAR